MRNQWKGIVRLIVLAGAALPFALPANGSSTGTAEPLPYLLAQQGFSWSMFVPGTVSHQQLPDRYDLREHNLLTPVKNQNGLRSDGISDLGSSVGLCWAFASLNSFESSLLKQKIVASPTDARANLSPWHLGNYIGFNLPVYEFNPTLMPGVEPDTTFGYVKAEGGWGGGGGFWACDYMIRGDGPLLWKDAPMPNDQMTNHQTLQKPAQGTPADYLVQEMLLLDPDDFPDKNGDVDEVKFREKIKRSILKYGAIQSFIHLEAIDCPGVEKQTCNGRTYTGRRFMDKSRYNLYTYDTEDLCSDLFTHAVSISGWDDHRIINVDGHATRGAWLIKDSIGTNSHDKGYFWVAYDDRVHLQFMASAFVALSGAGYKHPSRYQTHPGGLSRTFPGEETAMNEANIISLGTYAYLLDGYNNNREDSWGIARFQFTENETLKGVGIFTSNPNETVTIHLHKGWEDFTADRDNPLFAQTYNVSEKGYHLLTFDQEIQLLAGEELIIGTGFMFTPDHKKQPLVYVRDTLPSGPITYRTSHTRDGGWSALESYENACPGFWSGFFLQAVVASDS